MVSKGGFVLKRQRWMVKAVRATLRKGSFHIWCGLACWWTLFSVIHILSYHRAAPINTAFPILNVARWEEWNVNKLDVFNSHFLYLQEFEHGAETGLFHTTHAEDGREIRWEENGFQIFWIHLLTIKFRPYTVGEETSRLRHYYVQIF